eukprot:6288623-Amphidinium_carterae.1
MTNGTTELPSASEFGLEEALLRQTLGKDGIHLFSISGCPRDWSKENLIEFLRFIAWTAQSAGKGRALARGL